MSANYYLVIFRDEREPIIVTDDIPMKGDFIIAKKLLDNVTTPIDIQEHLSQYFKVIAGIPQCPQINFTEEVAYLIKERYGFVDAMKIAEQIVTSHPDFKVERFSEYQNGKLNGVLDGLKAAQSLKKFCVEDLYLLSAFVTDFIAGRKGDFVATTPKDIADKFMQSLTHYTIKIEVAMKLKEPYRDRFNDMRYNDFEPDIRNNKITVTNIQ